jgi:dTMP kinase
MFIVFEGIEGCGKSTQAALLSERIKKTGKEVVLTKEPGGTEFGERIREILLNFEFLSDLTELFLFLADRKEHIERVIKPSLENGKVVICDRYFYSTLAYQIGGRKLDRKLVEMLSDIVVDGTIPDIVFYLDISPEISFLRKEKHTLDRIEKESLDFHHEIRNEYLSIAKLSENFVILDGEKDILQLHQEICEIISKKFHFPL